MTNTVKTPIQAHYATKEITPVMVEFIKYIEAETGYKVDPISVQLSSLMRSAFQQSDANQKRLAKQAADVTAEKLARAERAAARVAAARARGSIIDTPFPGKPAAKKAPVAKAANV